MGTRRQSQSVLAAGTLLLLPDFLLVGSLCAAFGIALFSILSARQLLRSSRLVHEHVLIHHFWDVVFFLSNGSAINGSGARLTSLDRVHGSGCYDIRRRLLCCSQEQTNCGLWRGFIEIMCTPNAALFDSGPPIH
jgi:hypothetical protein